MNIQAAKTKIVNSIISCETIEQLDTCDTMINVLKRNYLSHDVFLAVMNMRSVLAEKRVELVQAGCCEKCGEPINNAEYDLCPQCRQEAIEYQRDVNEEMGTC